MNASQLARKVGASSRAIGDLIRDGHIKASKAKRAWDIDDKTAAAFCTKNAAAAEKLKAEYVTLYWGGFPFGSSKPGCVMTLLNAASWVQWSGLPRRLFTMIWWRHQAIAQNLNRGSCGARPRFPHFLILEG